MDTAKIAVAEDFSRVPAGRYSSDGPLSGEEFRKKHLVPALDKNKVVVVYLDGVEGYGSSFLEEAFGGLVRRDRFSSDDLHQRLKIETRDPAWKKEIWDYIDRSLGM